MIGENIKGKDIRYTIKAIIDIPADEPESVEDYLEHLREIGSAAIVAVEIVGSGSTIPDIEEAK